MDADGEDDPFQIETMLNEARKNKNFIITSNRKKKERVFIDTSFV